VSDCYLTPNK